MSESATPALPELSAVDAEIRRMALATPASELHGGLCGWLAGAALMCASGRHG